MGGISGMSVKILYKRGEDEGLRHLWLVGKIWIGSLEEITIGELEGFQQAWASASRRGSGELEISANRGGVHRGAWASKGVSPSPC